MSNKQALKSGVWYTIANFLMRSIGLITTPIFTRLLTHEEFGLYNNFTSWLSIFTIIVTLNLESTFISARYDYEDSFDKYISSVLALSTLSCLVAVVILNTLFTSIQSVLGMSRLYLNSMMTYLLFLPAINMFQARERFMFKYRVSVFLSLLVSVSTALLSVLLVASLNNGLNGRVFGSIIPSILIGIVLYAIIWQKGKAIKTEYWGYAIKICIPYIPHLLSMIVLNSVDRIMITHYCGAADNALYSLAYSCGSIISILIVSLNTAYSPWLGENLHYKRYMEINAFAKKYILGFIVMAFLVMIFTPEVLLILGGRSYLEAIFVLPPIACGCIFQFLYTMFVNVEQFSKKTIGMAVASVSAALMNYGLNMVFIPIFGYVAAAYTTLVGFFWLLGIHMYLVYKYGMKQVYPYKYVGLIVVVSFCFTAGVNMLYLNSVLRYIFGGIYVIALSIVALKNKNYILRTISALKEK